MLLPEHTIVEASHRGMTVDGITAVLSAASPPPRDMPDALGRAVVIRERVLEVLRQHRPCAQCDEFTRIPSPPPPPPFGYWHRTPRRAGDAPDMVFEGEAWYLHPPAMTPPGHGA